MRWREEIASAFGIGLVIAGIFYGIRSPYLFSGSEREVGEEMVSGRKVVLLRETALDIFAAAPVFRFAEAVYILDRRNGARIREFINGREAAPGMLVFHKAGSFNKYSGTKSMENDGLGLKWCGMYDIDSRIYDVYVKLGAGVADCAEAFYK